MHSGTYSEPPSADGRVLDHAVCRFVMLTQCVCAGKVNDEVKAAGPHECTDEGGTSPVTEWTLTVGLALTH